MFLHHSNQTLLDAMLKKILLLLNYLIWVECSALLYTAIHISLLEIVY